MPCCNRQLMYQRKRCPRNQCSSKIIELLEDIQDRLINIEAQIKRDGRRKLTDEDIDRFEELFLDDISRCHRDKHRLTDRELFGIK